MIIYTIGHSTHSLGHFLGLLAANEVTAVVDVRSYPYSRRNPQFNRPTLKSALAERHVRYLFLGRELGARCDDKSCYDGGKVVYGRLAARPEFKHAIGRVLKGAEQYRVVLMCAERDPITCHRTILVAKELTTRGASIAHIRADGSLEAHDAAMDRLMETLRLPKDDLYVPRSQLLERAYEQQEARIAYVDSGNEREESDIAWA